MNDLESKTIILREDARGIHIIPYPNSNPPETHINYISDSHPNKNCIEAIKGIWIEDSIKNNIVKLK